MKRQLRLVREFHRKIGETVAQSSILLQHDAKVDADLARSLRQIVERFHHSDGPKTQLTQRALMAVEELAEWIEAHNEDDLTAAADAWADRMYLLLGDAVATGLPTEPLLDEVHRSNMTKTSANNKTGKGIKSDVFDSPNLERVLEQAVSTAEVCANCHFMMWMVGIGQGVQCSHPANRGPDGQWMPIPSGRFSCEHFERIVENDHHTSEGQE